jgi:hypothetical protein
MRYQPSETAAVRVRTDALRYVPADVKTARVRTDPLRYRPTEVSAIRVRTGALRYRPSEVASIRVQTDTLRYEPTETASVRMRTDALRYAPVQNDDSIRQSMDYVAFPYGPVSANYLAIDNATWSAEVSEPINYQNVPADLYHYLSAWFREQNVWRQSHSKQINPGSGQGRVDFSITWPGEYRICIDVAPNKRGYSKTPDEASECIPLFVVWGDPDVDYQPLVSFGDDPLVAGKETTLAWSGFPAAPFANIEIYASGDTDALLPAWRTTTQGEEAGQARIQLDEPGDYVLYVFFENLGRQIRARHGLTVENPE